ncbi:hypothetical protein ACNJX9_34050 [Bradyrhizobium sp. DASA03076]|uniref:hypothetical protein n=1 Tax=Bradyrhizobium sp. BLXBL-03 TaxID=3395916 RepID=UPI003F707416
MIEFSDLPFWPAALRLDQAAAYCGLSVPTFSAVWLGFRARCEPGVTAVCAGL